MHENNDYSNSKYSKKSKREIAVKYPFSYYYNCSKDVSNKIVYCNVCQCLNDRDLGTILQNQYFAIAEQSERILFLNELLIKQAIKDCKLYPNIKFVVQISPKFLESKDYYKKLINLLNNSPNNLILSFDARPLVISGDIGKRNLEDLVDRFNLEVMLDQIETERMTMLFEYPINYIRLDMRYYLEKNESKKIFINILSEFCKKKKITLCAKYVDTKDERSWIFANGVRYIEGLVIQNIKFNLKNALR